MEQLQPLLDDAVAAIVEDDEGHRQFLVSRGPQRLDRIHGAAVSKQGDDLALRLRELDAHRGGNAPADTAADIAEIRVAIAQMHEGWETRCRRQSLIDDYGVLRQQIGDRQHQPFWIDRTIGCLG